MHELARVLEARQVAQCGHRGHGDGALDTPQSLESLDHRSEAPGVHLLVECEFQTAQPFSLCSDGLDIFLKDNVLRWGRTDNLAEPAPVGRAPVELDP